jgi:type II secretory pathway pseudopilin PulG
MNQKGQSLIEALVALGAAVIIVSAITIAVITAVNNSDFAKYQNLANGYAQQGIQVIQQKAQLDWNDTATYSGAAVWCLPQGTTDFYSHDILPTDPNCSDNSVNVADKFFRQVSFTKISPSNNCNGLNPPPCCITGTPVDCSASLDNARLCSSKATVTVSWTDGKCSQDSSSVNYYCHQVKLDTCITDINRTQQ